MRCCGCWSSTGYERAKAVIKSCKTYDHLAVAQRYAELALKKVFNHEHIKLDHKQFEMVKLNLQDLLGKQEIKIRRRPYEETKSVS